MDESQGVPLTTIQELARYWATDYDWREIEAKVNALPQFITEVDGRGRDSHGLQIVAVGTSGPLLTQKQNGNVPSFCLQDADATNPATAF